MKHTFTPKSFAKMANLTEEVRKLLGQNSHAETTYASVVIEYSPEFQAMLRPFPPQEVYDFELKQFRCSACNKPVLVIAAATTVYDKCDECRAKQSPAKAKK